MKKICVIIVLAICILNGCKDLAGPVKKPPEEKPADQEKIEITNASSIIRSGTQITYTGTTQDVIFSLKTPVDGVSITPQGMLTYEYGKMFTYKGVSPAEGSRPQDGLRNTLTQGQGFTAQTFTVAAESADGLLRAEKTFTASREFYDDFRGGINYNDWYIPLKNWGGTDATAGNGNRVSRADHVQYSATEGLYLYAGGDYSGEANRRRSGAAIVSKQPFGAGRYEIRAKAHPRLGVCSAIWPFFYDDINGDGINIDNHEIDIEIPGRINASGQPGSAGYPSFESLLVTPWLREETHTTTYLKTAAPANDGAWHIYAFEWHTLTDGSGKVKGARVDFYVDGVMVKSETNTIPFISAGCWIGVWFPAVTSQYNGVYDIGWAGTPDFEMDAMTVDYFHYTPFDNEPWMRSTDAKYLSSVAYNVSQIADESQYPQSPVENVNFPSFATNAGNWASNPGFENNTPITNAKVNATTSYPVTAANAWSVSGGAAITSGNANSGGRMMSVPSGGSANQLISGVYSAYAFDVSAWARSAAPGATGVMRVEFLGFTNELVGAGAANTIDTQLVTTSDYAVANRRVTAPAGTKKMRVTFITSSGTIYVDDVEIRMVR